MKHACPEESTQDWYLESVALTLERLAVDPNHGLSTSEIEARRARFGWNELVERTRISRWQMFVSQFSEVMVLVLAVAAVVSALLGEWLDAG